jgi:hypothetical protein
LNLERELIQLQHELKQMTYKPSAYHDFFVCDSKRRLISAAPYRDRVVHHSICNIIEPLRYYDDMSKLNYELENEDFRNDLLKGMNDYFTFIEAKYPHLKSLHGRLVPFTRSYTTDANKKVGLVGLNSAWMCRKSPDEREIAIGEYQLKKRLSKSKRQGNTT